MYFRTPVLVIGWTLSFEILFYTVVALCMKIDRKYYIPATILFFLCCIVFNYSTAPNNPMITFVGNPIILEFLLGVCAGIIYLRLPVKNSFIWKMVMFSGIAWLVIIVFTGYGYIRSMMLTLSGETSLQRVIIWGIPSALIVTGAVMLDKTGRFRSNRMLVNVGNASYSLYLIHIPFLQAVYMKWDSWGVTAHVPPDLLILVMLPLCAAAGYLFYRIIEKPLISYFQRLLINKKVSSIN